MFRKNGKKTHVNSNSGYSGLRINFEINRDLRVVAAERAISFYSRRPVFSCILLDRDNGVDSGIHVT